MKSLCIIPARGGSKRIPRKNIREFVGKPIIAWSIESAKHANCFERVIVSTDDEEIAEIAIKWGAEVPFIRPNNLADDMTGTIPVVVHGINWFDKKKDHYDAVCCIYATAPFIRQVDLLEGKKAIESGWQFAFPVTDFPAPIFRSFRVKSQGSVEMFFPEHFYTRSQDLEVAYHDAGQFYWGKVEAWKNSTTLFGETSKALDIPRKYVQDIDTEEDWNIAKEMFKLLNGVK